MKLREELYAVLVALPADTLLLPNAAVAEVIGVDRLERSGSGAPAWYAGRVNYNNRALHVVRFEVLNGARRSDDSRRTRVAIVHSVGDRLRGGQYAVMCQGYPHLVTLNRAALRKETNLPTDQERFVLTRVGIANTSAVIPNLEALEETLAAVDIAA